MNYKLLNKLNNTINSPQYDFLRENEHLGCNVCYLTFGGSYAHGTNTENSDIDIRGVALPWKSDILGFTQFEQVEDRETDTTVYNIQKFVKLCLDNNPNAIELLYPREDVYVASNSFNGLLKIRHSFLSQRIVRTFSGYAMQQLRRLENAVCYDRYTPEMQNKHLLSTLINMKSHLSDQYDLHPHGHIDFTVCNNNFCIDMDVSNFPFKNLYGMMSEINEVIKTYNKNNHRNHKKDDNHLNKHAMHLVRLYLTAIGILEDEVVYTYNPKYTDILINIRNGCYMNEDGTYHSSFFELVDYLEKRLQLAKKDTSLPTKPRTQDIYDVMKYILTDVWNERV